MRSPLVIAADRATKVKTRANSRANAGKARNYIGCHPHQQAAMTNPAPQTLGESPLTSEAPCIVLDSNVVLDWLLFGEPSVAALALAVTSGRVCWVATARMRDELAHVLGRGFATSRQVDASAVLGTWDTHAVIHPEPPTQRLQCTDPDDQKFIDLAIGTGARWLVSRDRAVLKLARRAASAGVAIVKPEALRLGTAEPACLNS